MQQRNTLLMQDMPGRAFQQGADSSKYGKMYVVGQTTVHCKLS